MHSLTLGAATEPPLSPPTVGRPTLVEIPALEPVQAATAQEAPAAEQDTALRRVVVRLVAGDQLEVARVDGLDAADAAAQELVARLATAERDGEWPMVGGRYLRPASIVSVDVLRADD